MEITQLSKTWHAICSNMDGPGDCHTQWNKSEKDKYNTVICKIYIFKYNTYILNIKNGTNELIYKTESLIQKTNLQLPEVKQGGGINWETEIDTYTLLCIK